LSRVGTPKELQPELVNSELPEKLRVALTISKQVLGELAVLELPVSETLALGAYTAPLRTSPLLPEIATVPLVVDVPNTNPAVGPVDGAVNVTLELPAMEIPSVLISVTLEPDTVALPLIPIEPFT
jgi:hypothetical protein